MSVTETKSKLLLNFIHVNVKETTQTQLVVLFFIFPESNLTTVVYEQVNIFQAAIVES